MRSKKKAFYKRGTVITAGVLSLLAVLGLAGIYRLESKKNKADQELVNWEEIDADASKKDTTYEHDPDLELIDKDEADGQRDRLDPDAGSSDAVSDGGTNESRGTANEGISGSIEDQTDMPAGDDAVAQASVSSAKNLDFKPEDGMLWPVEGNVILDYSMDQSIYFPTLDQYKYNPAIAIQGERGTEVVSAADGKITSVVENEETGITMTVDLGNGYQAVYGQLADVTLSEGSYIEAGSRIGVIAEPSIYYQVEGDNLYFQVLKDNVPQDPLDLIR